MEATAISRSVRISPRKVRLVTNAIAKKSASEALRILAILDKRAAYPLEKTLKSAIANAVSNKKLAANDLMIKRLEITEGQALKRFHPSTRGRVHPYKKRSSHIRIVLSDDKSQISNIKSQTNKE